MAVQAFARVSPPGAGAFAFLGRTAAAGHLVWQVRALDPHDGDRCLRLFRSNRTFGWILFGGLVADSAMRFGSV